MFERVAAYLAEHLNLSEVELQSLASLFKPRRFGRKQRVIGPGESGSFDLFIASGCLRIYSVTSDGSDRNLHFGTENSWWSHGSLQTFPSLPVGIDALERTDVLMIDSVSKERLCADMPKFDRVFRFLTQHTLTALQHRLIISLQNTAEARYQEFSRFYPRLEARIPHYHVASFLGICPEFFSKLRKKRSLTTSPGTPAAQLFDRRAMHRMPL